MRCRSLSADTFYVAYSTAHQVVGVMAWPLDGDPNKSLALIAHPGNIAGMNLSHDGCKLVTAGADDGSIMIWQVLSPSQTLIITIATCTVIVPFTLSVTAPLHISSWLSSWQQKAKGAADSADA
jgi:WD40 repeat protein